MSENGVKNIFEGNCDANFEGQSKADICTCLRFKQNWKTAAKLKIVAAFL